MKELLEMFEDVKMETARWSIDASGHCENCNEPIIEASLTINSKPICVMAIHGLSGDKFQQWAIENIEAFSNLAALTADSKPHEVKKAKSH